MQGSVANWVVCFIFFFSVSFCQLFGCFWLPWWGAIPSMAFCGAVAIFGLVALSKKVGHLILFYIIGSALGEVPTISSFGYSIYLLTNYCYDYYDYYNNCYNGWYSGTAELVINACFTGATIIMWPLMVFFLYKEKKQLMGSVAVLPTTVAQPAPGVFFTQPTNQPIQQLHYQPQYMATQQVQQAQQTTAAPPQSGSWQ